MATELLMKEQKIAELQHALEDQRENEKQMYDSCFIKLHFKGEYFPNNTSFYKFDVFVGSKV